MPVRRRIPHAGRPSSNSSEGRIARAAWRSQVSRDICRIGRLCAGLAAVRCAFCGRSPDAGLLDFDRRCCPARPAVGAATRGLRPVAYRDCAGLVLDLRGRSARSPLTPGHRSGRSRRLASSRSALPSPRRMLQRTAQPSGYRHDAGPAARARRISTRSSTPCPDAMIVIDERGRDRNPSAPPPSGCSAGRRRRSIGQQRQMLMPSPYRERPRRLSRPLSAAPASGASSASAASSSASARTARPSRWSWRSARCDPATSASSPASSATSPSASRPRRGCRNCSPSWSTSRA